ncbi:hypothetical protein Tco_0783909 [Tanacetum coccineum]
MVGCENTDQSTSSPVTIEVPRELPKVSLVSLKKLKYHLGQFDNVVKKKITPDALIEGEWGFEYTKTVFLKEIIPFIKTLKDISNVFDKDLSNEETEVQIVFNQIEANVQQYFVDKQCSKIQKKQFLIKNDRILDQIISQDIVNIVVNSLLDIKTFVNVNSSAAMNDSVNYVEMCNKYLKLKAKLIKQHNMVEKDEYNRLSKSFSKLEQHCISLELAMQLNKESFQKNNTSVNQTEPSFDQLFELNNLKAELQVKDITIEKLKANIKCLNKTSTTNSAKKTYKQLYDSTKPLRLHSKEYAESLVNQLNQKSVKITDLNGQLQENVFVTTTLKNDLRKFKGKDIVDNAFQVSNDTTIALGMYKLDPIVEQAKSLNPLDSASYFALSWSTKSSRLKSTNNTKNDRILQISSSKQKKNKVEDHFRIVNSMFDARHELCFLEFVYDMNPSCKSKPTGRTFTLVGNAYPLTRIIATNKVPLREPIPLEVVSQESIVTKVYTRRPKVVQIVLWYLDSRCSKNMTGDRSQLTNFVHKFLDTVKFGNDQIEKIMGYGDY